MYDLFCIKRSHSKHAFLPCSHDFRNVIKVLNRIINIYLYYICAKVTTPKYIFTLISMFNCLDRFIQPTTAFQQIFALALIFQIHDAKDVPK